MTDARRRRRDRPDDPDRDGARGKIGIDTIVMILDPSSAKVRDVRSGRQGVVMALADIYWEVAPILNERAAGSLDTMRKGLAQKWPLHQLQKKSLKLGAAEALHIVGDKPSVKSFIEKRDEVFASVTLTGAKNGGMCCVGSVSHAGISQVSSLSKMLTKGFVKAPTVLLDQGNRQALANGIGATMTTRCRIQLFYSTAIEAMRDDLLFFLDHDLAIPGEDFLLHLRDSGFLRNASGLKAGKKPKGQAPMVNI